SVQVVEVAHQRTVVGKRRSDQLDERLGIVRRDVRVGQRRTERLRMAALRQAPLGRDAQRLALDAAQPAGQQALLAAVDHGRHSALIDAIDTGACHQLAYSLWAAGPAGASCRPATAHAGPASCLLLAQTRNAWHPTPP